MALCFLKVTLNAVWMRNEEIGAGKAPIKNYIERIFASFTSWVCISLS